MARSNKKYVAYMGLASFFNDAGTELLTPLLPAFVFALGGTEFLVGVISAIKEALPPLVNFVGGYIGERFGAKRTTLLSYILSGLGKLGVALSTSLAWLFSAISLDRIGKGIRGPARDSWISALMPRKRGEGFAIRQFLDSAGALLGSLLAAYLISIAVPIKNIAILAGLFGLAGAIPIYFVPAMEKKLLKAEISVSLSYAAFVFLMYFTAFGVVIAISLAENVFEGATLFILYNIVYVLSVYPAGLLADKWGKEKILSLALIFFVIASLLFMNSLLIYAFAVFALGYASFKSNLKAIVGDWIGTSAKGFGFLEGAMGLGALTGNIVLGWAIQQYGGNAFYIPIASAILSFALLIMLSRKKVKKISI